jgi:hypothetical protein
MIEGTLAVIADALPNGFHDAELLSLFVDWEAREAVLRGEAWVATDGPPEVYRPFELGIQGLHLLELPSRPDVDATGRGFDFSLANAPSCDGIEGWPPHRQPTRAVPAGAFVYSLFVFSWNEFITLAGEQAVLRWQGPAYDRQKT